MSSAARRGAGEVGEARGDPEAQGRLLDLFPIQHPHPTFPVPFPPFLNQISAPVPLCPPGPRPGAALATSDSQEGLPSSGLPRWPPGAAGPQRLTWWELLAGCKGGGGVKG